MSPESYTPRHLAERILTSKATLEGERKQVTVLFADMKGSMELLADRDPEEARKLLDPVIERMMEAVHRYEGIVNQVMGDGIMALFGAPVAHEDHAVRACYAALRMQESVKQYSDGVRRVEGVPIRVRVGLNSGEVVVRAIGADLHMDYTAVGQTTHVAARMEQLAAPETIVLTPTTLALADGFVEVKPLGPTPLKGLSEPLDVFELTGAGHVRSRLHAVVARGLTRFVGRGVELAQLEQALERARGGHGQVVAVIGEPGVGKSRLFWEFVRSSPVRGWLVLESGAVAHGRGIAYLPVAGLLRSYFGIEGRDDVRKVREKVGGKIVALDEALLPSLPALLALLDVPVEDRAWQGLDPPQRRKQTIDACKRLLIRESQVEPLLLVLEDLHWVDSETQALLDGLVDALSATRALLLVNYRPEYQHGWGSKAFYTQLRVEPLLADSAGALLGILLGADPSLESLKQLLIARTEGNPFFLEESVRTLIEAGILVGERGGYRLTRAMDTIRVPPTVQAVLGARIDRLPPLEKRLLQSAAVVGKDVPLAILQAVADLSDEELRQGLERLQAAEFLYEAKLFPDLEYTFKHALTHDVAYESLLHERRRTLHRSIVGAIERLHPHRLAECAERLASHAVRGQVWEKAVTYSREAGNKALARSANREAVACFEQAIAALGHLPESRTTLEQAVDMRLPPGGADRLGGARPGARVPRRSRGSRPGSRRPAPARLGLRLPWTLLLDHRPSGRITSPLGGGPEGCEGRR
jgi:class 3 adenylate cyclase/DNA-binding IscR family transcriptional regulator